MFTMNLGSKPLLRACAFMLVALTPAFSLAQDPFKEIPKLQERIHGLHGQIIASQERLLASQPYNAREDRAFTLLDRTSNGLHMTYREFEALGTYKVLASLITGKLDTQYAMGIVVLQRDYLKKISKGQIEWVEKSLHTAGDQETSRLLLETRDLFRASAELLDRLQIPAP
jgi:hypothetical protein